MASTVGICNQALAAMGSRSTIASLTESSKEARECNRIFDAVRDELLREALWNFARRSILMSLLKERSTAINWSTAEPPTPWAYSYAFPTDCIRARYLWPVSYASTYANVLYNYGQPQHSPFIPRWNYDYYYCEHPPFPFSIMGDEDEDGNDIRVIATDLETAMLIYTKRVESPNLWDSLFQQAMVATLAARLAIPLSGDKEMMKLNMQLAANAVAKAQTADANEGHVLVTQSDPDWICARG